MTRRHSFVSSSTPRLGDYLGVALSLLVRGRAHRWHGTLRGPAAVVLVVAVCTAGGCQSSGRGSHGSNSHGPYASDADRGYYDSPREASRDCLLAQRLTQEAATLMDEGIDNDDAGEGGDTCDAENRAKAVKLLRQALTADLYHGPAHNNLGVLHLEAGRLYEAASEFEWARKLMPGHPDPRLNLGLTLERAGRVDEALAAYESALETYRGHLPTLQALTRLQICHSLEDDRTEEFLGEIAVQGDDEWQGWAKAQLVRFNGR